MLIDVTTPWLSGGTYDRQRAEELFGGPDSAYDAATVRHILDAVDADCGLCGFNAGALLAQMSVETGWFTFTGDAKPEQYNYGGIGTTGGGVPGVSFATPEEGVHGMLAHHAGYLFGDLPAWPITWGWLRPYAVRLSNVLAAGYGGTVEVIGDYGGGAWAVDENYANKIVARGQEFGATSDATGEATMAVPQPPMLFAPRSPNHGYNNGFTHEPRLVVWHVTDGSNSLGWLTSPQSGASSNYLIGRDGTINELVPPDLSAWANGDAQSPDLSNPEIARIDAEGANYNQRCISIESEAYSTYWEPGALISPQQVAALIWLTAWLCDSLGIAPDRTHVVRHQQINDVTRHNCPGFSEEREMVPWINAVAAICRGEAGVKEPTAGNADQYINARGETIAVVNFGGLATKIKGVAYQDIGALVTGDDGHDYQRSVLAGVMEPWRDLGPTKT